MVGVGEDSRGSGSGVKEDLRLFNRDPSFHGAGKLKYCSAS
jgi:hypothetical protein